MTTATFEPPTTEAPALAEPAGRAPARRASSSRSCATRAYLLLALPMGILTFTVAVAGWSTAISTLLTFIGVPVAVLTIGALRLLVARRAPPRGHRARRAGGRALQGRPAGPPRGLALARRHLDVVQGPLRGPPDVARPALRAAAAAGRDHRLHGHRPRVHDDGRVHHVPGLVVGAARRAGTPASGSSTAGPTRGSSRASGSS